MNDIKLKRIVTALVAIVAIQLFALTTPYDSSSFLVNNNEAFAKNTKAVIKNSKPFSSMKVGNKIKFGGMEWYVYNPQNGGIVLSHNDGDRAWNYANNDYKYSLIRRYLNKGFLNKIPKEDQALIQDWTWNCGFKDNEDDKQVSDKVGLLTYEEIDTFIDELDNLLKLGEDSKKYGKYYYGWLITLRNMYEYGLGFCNDKVKAFVWNNRYEKYYSEDTEVETKQEVRPVIHLNEGLFITKDGTVFSKDISINEEHNMVIDNGIIKLSAFGGSGSYEYSIDNGMSWSESNEFTRLKEGIYTVKARDKVDKNKESNIRTVELKKAKLYSVLKFKDAVFFADKQWIVLNPSNGLLMMSENDGNRQWDKNWSSDYENSSVRKYLNKEFSNKISQKDQLLIQDWRWNCGEDKFVTDKIGLLSKSEYDMYSEDLLSKYGINKFNWWLINPDLAICEDEDSKYPEVNEYPSGLKLGVRPVIHIRRDLYVTEDREIVFDDRNLIAQIESADIYLYSKDEENGLINKMILKIGDKEKYLNWENVSNRAYVPELILVDIDDDKTYEFVITLYKNNKFGVIEKEVHVINIKTLDEIDTTN
ncbi:DUF6273 domain-containing protein [Abyssisolibacter fermentans]|uniref:DUF6273 domain-containing protein n=1 Tax=Abyssisolibacter fermentans TaxID=1766203 RepID=UPI00082EE28C|nr:DUF6273 domain-containing protein [Abyssisolibacter fermentans]